MANTSTWILTCLWIDYYYVYFLDQQLYGFTSPIKGPRRFLEQETFPLLLSTGWFQERI